MTRTRSCSRETTTIHGCFDSHCARRSGYRYGCPLDWFSTPPFQGCCSLCRESLKLLCAFGRLCDRPSLLERNKIERRLGSQPLAFPKKLRRAINFRLEAFVHG